MSEVLLQGCSKSRLSLPSLAVFLILDWIHGEIEAGVIKCRGNASRIN